MIGIRQKLILGFGSLLAIITCIGALTISQMDDLGQAIDVILKENYRSVAACLDMKESLERMDSGLLLFLVGNEQEGDRLLTEYTAAFQRALRVELGNITLPGEREAAEHIRTMFGEYGKAVLLITRTSDSLDTRKTAYFSVVQPVFLEIKAAAHKILLMNQANMNEANEAARRLAASARRRMFAAITAAAFLSLLFTYLVQRWILHPVNKLIESSNEIRRGNLDLVLAAKSRDEIGLLAESFNEMASALRIVRKEDRIHLTRTRRAMDEVFKALPEVIAVLDPDGRVEVATEPADRQFGLKPGVLADDLDLEWLAPLIQKAMDENRMVTHGPKGGYIQRFIDNREFFFQPLVVPIAGDPKHKDSAGIALILKDITQVHEQQELKRSVVSTVSHQLRTPLTSLRMSVHLLLEERVGPINEKQAELLMTAREDSQRLVTILDDLLDLQRLESGKSYLASKPVAPRALVRDAVEPFLPEARDKGLTIINAVTEDLPEIAADVGKIRHVFTNLISNAIRFSSPGGSVTVTTRREADHVRFSIEDNGMGIPAEHMGQLFEQFYRVPGQNEQSGVGLGLAIVKEIIQAHGGDVTAESEVGKGSTFHFTLPLWKPDFQDKQGQAATCPAISTPNKE